MVAAYLSLAWIVGCDPLDEVTEGQVGQLLDRHCAVVIPVYIADIPLPRKTNFVSTAQRHRCCQMCQVCICRRTANYQRRDDGIATQRIRHFSPIPGFKVSAVDKLLSRTPRVLCFPMSLFGLPVAVRICANTLDDISPAGLPNACSCCVAEL